MDRAAKKELGIWCRRVGENPFRLPPPSNLSTCTSRTLFAFLTLSMKNAAEEHFVAVQTLAEVLLPLPSDPIFLSLASFCKDPCIEIPFCLHQEEFCLPRGLPQGHFRVMTFCWALSIQFFFLFGILRERLINWEFERELSPASSLQMGKLRPADVSQIWQLMVTGVVSSFTEDCGYCSCPSLAVLLWVNRFLRVLWVHLWTEELVWGVQTSLLCTTKCQLLIVKQKTENKRPLAVNAFYCYY